jgi:hypothetical protein
VRGLRRRKRARPSATGREYNSVRSISRSGDGARRAWIRRTVATSSAVSYNGGFGI